MPHLDNLRHEKFCRYIVQGRTADQAYADAGYRPHRGNAARLRANESVIARIAELRIEWEHKEELTVQMVIEGLLKEAQREGEGTSQSARISAWGLLAKHLGMLVDRKIIGIKRLEDMGDDELRQIAGQVIEELDAQVSVDGEVQPVEAELLGPPAGGGT
jgi:hypothetical protein